MLGLFVNSLLVWVFVWVFLAVSASFLSSVTSVLLVFFASVRYAAS